LGRTYALALAKAGADIAITSRSLAALDGTARAVEALGRRCYPVELEVRSLDSIHSAVDCVYERARTIDILVNNAVATSATRA